ncbi:RidA family protein [Daejeonella sp.]|jgi:enamine deaminase RidA (YjgF/YER057c/UK114 family)|uniref:RidA family protein n=1 Tax=Daejeonella sp. TaxID=2805397 RepID=UPI0037BF285D
MKRVNISSGAVWEDLVGYSRAVRIGNQIEISGTTSVDGETVMGKGDLYFQTIFIFQKIEKTLTEAGASIKDVVRTRMYVTDISKWEEAGRAHSEFFKNIKPATSMIEVSRLIKPELLIEIEVTAIIQE